MWLLIVGGSLLSLMNDIHYAQCPLPLPTSIVVFVFAVPVPVPVPMRVRGDRRAGYVGLLVTRRTTLGWSGSNCTQLLVQRALHCLHQGAVCKLHWALTGIGEGRGPMLCLLRYVWQHEPKEPTSSWPGICWLLNQAQVCIWQIRASACCWVICTESQLPSVDHQLPAYGVNPGSLIANDCHSHACRVA